MRTTIDGKDKDETKNMIEKAINLYMLRIFNDRRLQRKQQKHTRKIL